MASVRSEYDDKNLKKNAFSGRLLRLELDRLDNQKDQISKQFRHEKDQLRKQLAEGEGILKLKHSDPAEITLPLSSTDRKKLSPGFARKLSVSQINVLPQIVAPQPPPEISKVALLSPRPNRRRLSLPPTIAPQESTHYECGNERKRSQDNLTVPKLLQRRASASNALQKDSEDITGRINDFFQRLSKSSENVNIEYQSSKKEELKWEHETKTQCSD
ncbi:uncharacterized protein LOC114535192 [Dendronephthya gigantea]|uniref:uncharacterized protein LOC114535192 n=1 Tax=Dendronephthya gigantea TaxID=151771 RepID=UPI00106ADEBB|nr:uncharacterized protein LOC114535192 [Dendronephthya gigantea]